jgi:hypothetical protein
MTLNPVARKVSIPILDGIDSGEFLANHLY